MSKQVRLRRGTTAQHSTFTGAEAEVTVDTTKKVLVLHDGVTPGGKPIDGWVKLDPGNTLLNQEIKSCLRVSGGNEDLFGLQVDAGTNLASLSVSGDCELRNISIVQADLNYAATVNLDFGSYGTRRLSLSGNVTFTTSNVGFSRELLVRIVADGSLRNLTFPAGWKFVGSAAPASIAANKTALLRLWCFGITDAQVVAHYFVEA